MTTGIFLVNLGTPDAAQTGAVRRYLREFLMDERVIDLPLVARMILVNGIIALFRARRSAKAYARVWTNKGSPLLVYSQQLRDKLANGLGEHYKVVLGMRYGNPSIANAAQQLNDCDKIIVIPLFPQYSSAATGSAMQRVMQVLQKGWNIADIIFINQFYNHPQFIDAYAQIISQYKKDDDFLLTSYHGLPERHVKKSGCHPQCDLKNVCPPMGRDNQFCYRAQCYATTRALAKFLELDQSQYAVSFQSRLGKIPWIQPYTDEFVKQLREQGIKNLCVVCPAFTADCLETIEEIGMELRGQWQELGGERFTLVPCLNASEVWVHALQVMIHEREAGYA